MEPVVCPKCGDKVDPNYKYLYDKLFVVDPDPGEVLVLVCRGCRAEVEFKRPIQGECPWIELTWEETARGAVRGLCLQLNGRIEGYDLYAAPTGERGIKDLWGQSIEGMIGEEAVCKWQGVTLDSPTVEDVTASDLFGIQIRTAPLHNDRLIIRPGRDERHADKPFLLVIGHHANRSMQRPALPPRYVIRGWVYGYEGIDDRYLQKGTGGRPDWFGVPQERLWPVETLPLDRRAIPAESSGHRPGSDVLPGWAKTFLQRIKANGR